MEMDDSFVHRLMWVIWPAFLVAACLSVVAVAGSLFVRTPDTDGVPAAH